MKKTTILKTMMLAAVLIGSTVGAWADAITARTPNGELCYSEAVSGLTYGATRTLGVSSIDANYGWLFNNNLGARYVTLTLPAGGAFVAGDVIEIEAIQSNNGAGVGIYTSTSATEAIETFSCDRTLKTYSYIVVANDGISEQQSFTVGRSVDKNVYVKSVKVLRSGADDLRPNTLAADKTWTFDSFDVGSASANLVNDDLYYYNAASIEEYSKVAGHTKAIKLTNSNTLMFVVPAGTGKVEVQFLSSNGYNRSLKYQVGSNSATTAGITNNTNGVIMTFGYSVTKDTQIKLLSDNSARAYATSISVKLDKETVSFSSYGYASYSCPNAIDLTDVTTATAYVATGVADGKVALKKVTGVIPAGTGLILKGTANSSVDIPFASSAEALAETNLLQAVTQAPQTVAAGDGVTNYVLTVQNEKVVFAPIGSTSATVKAGQAYLQTTSGGGEARSLAFSFDDETTGIVTIGDKRTFASGYYNLSGQRISLPTKGLYIVNGKKVVVK